MATYEPGTVAVATVRGVPNVRVFRTARDFEPWGSAEYVKGGCCDGDDDCGGHSWHTDAEVTDIRPLIVLDPEDAEQMERLTKAFVDGGVWRVIPVEAEDLHAYRRDQIKAAIERQARLPKPPEPTGLGAVVEDAEGCWWVHCQEGWRWYRGGKAKQYRDVEAVRVLSEGVPADA